MTTARAPSLQRRSLVVAGIATGLLQALLSGCATPQTGTASTRAGANHWSGRLSLNVDSSPPEQFYASFELSGSEEAGQLSLNSPLGNTIALLRWQPGHAMLQQGGKSRDYPSVDELAAAVTGTPIPIRSLFAWLRGEDATVAGWTADLEQLEQGRISAQRYDPAPAARLRVILQNDDS